MDQLALIPTPEKTVNYGEIYADTKRTVDLVRRTPEIAESLAGQCALALQLALEADNVATGEKAYARVKLYDSLGAILDRLHQAIEGVGAVNASGALAAVLDLVREDPADEGADL